MRIVRRAGIAALAVLVLGAPGAGVAGAVEARNAGAAVLQAAFADWIVDRDRDSALAYFAIALRDFADGSGGGATALIGKAQCSIQRSRHFTAMMCAGRARPHDVGFADFQLDPLLRSGHLLVRDGKTTHEVDWTGRGRGPDVQQSLAIGPHGAELAVMEGRMATAGGRVLGRRVEPSRGFLQGRALLFQGAAAGIASPIRSSGDGGTRVQWSYTIRR